MVDEIQTQGVQGVQGVQGNGINPIETKNKPLIETLINTSALALTSFGVMEITNGRLLGYLSLSFGMFLEFFKYFGREKKLW